MRIKTFISLVSIRVISFRFCILSIFIIIAYSTILSSINLNVDVCAREKQINNFPKPIFEHLTIANGLPNNNVLYILQDHLGYLWMGTSAGLVKYDGYNMKVYKSDSEDPFSISNGLIKTIFEDKSGILWIGTYGGGLNCFDRTTEQFTKYMHNPDDSTSIINNYITCINQDKNGNILVGTFEGLNLFNKKDKKFSRIYYQTSVYPKSVYEYLSGLKAKKKTISSILHVGDNANITKTFAINKKTVVLTIMMGEEGCDYGWMENERGEIIAQPGNRNLVYANGYPGNQIQVIIDTLDRGKYSLHYRSDYGWSYNSWVVKEHKLHGEQAPDYPDFWGIQVIELGKGEKNIEEVINNKKSIFRKYIVRDIIKDQMTGRIYVGIGNKIFIYDSVKNFFSYGNNFVVPKHRLGKINSFYQGKDGTIWIGHSEGLTKFNSLKNKFDFYQPIRTHYYNIKNSIGKIIEDNNGFIWSTTDRYGNPARRGLGLILRGLICFDPVKEQFQKYKHDSQNPETLSSDWVASLYKDRTGIVWAGTYEYGLNKWDNKKYKFKLFKHDPKNPKSKLFNTVYVISEDKEGIIWFGTDDGLYCFDRSSNIFHNYKYDINGSNPVKQIYIDSSEIIWIGTLTKGLGEFNRSTSTFQFYSNNPNDSTTISNNEVKSIIPGKNNILWIGTVYGLNRFDVKKGRFTRYIYDPKNPQSLFDNGINFFFKDLKGILWIGTLNGINKFNPNDGTFTHFNINDNAVMTAYEDKKENFWLGTFSDGIYLFDRGKEVTVFHITESNGLVHNSVKSILEDFLGKLWISTNYGISKFDPKNMEIKNYFAFGNYGDNRFSFNACKTSSGEMLFGTRHGFIMFNPDSVKDDPIPPQVVISNISLFNKPGEKLTDGYIPELHELNLSYDQNDLRFDFAGIHFGEPLKNKYKYILENFDDDWVEAGTQRNATYTNLDPGEYVFKVLSCNSDGVWSKEAASIRIIISPPYWVTWWAYSFYFLFGVVLLYSLRRYELNRAELKNQVKLDEVVLKEREETDKMKSRFFANISHEFRTPLTLILGPAEKISSQNSGDVIKDSNIIKRNSKRLLQLVNQLLDLSKLEAGKLKLEASKNNIVSFVKGIALSFESLSEEKDITLKILSEKEYVEIYFDKEKMIKILSNILSNSFKFTPQDGNVTITIKEYDKYVEIKIRDTGIGIPKEDIPKLFDRFYQVDSSFTKEYEGTGIGLALTKELVELHHGSISVESEMGEWTEFTIQFPAGREHLKDKEISTDDKEGKTKTIINEEKYFITRDSEEVSSDDIKTDLLEDDKTIVLIVEDNYDMREYIKESLERDYFVEEAVNGEQGVRKAEKIIPDLIITDMMMPKMDGNELTRILRNNEKTSHIPIIILTAKTGQESKLEGLETGADDYLTKPFDIKELQVRIANLIKIRRKLQEKYSKGEFISEHTKDFSHSIQTVAEKPRKIDRKFMDKILKITNEHISDEGFSVEMLGNKVGMSRSQVHRKIKALTGTSPNVYIRKIRLFKANEMIKNGDGNISEIAYSVGFSSPAHFSKCFKDEFGYPPSDLT